MADNNYISPSSNLPVWKPGDVPLPVGMAAQQYWDQMQNYNNQSSLQNLDAGMDAQKQQAGLGSYLQSLPSATAADIATNNATANSIGNLKTGQANTALAAGQVALGTRDSDITAGVAKNLAGASQSQLESAQTHAQYLDLMSQLPPVVQASAAPKVAQSMNVNDPTVIKMAQTGNAARGSAILKGAIAQVQSQQQPDTGPSPTALALMRTNPTFQQGQITAANKAATDRAQAESTANIEGASQRAVAGIQGAAQNKSSQIMADASKSTDQEIAKTSGEIADAQGKGVPDSDPQQQARYNRINFLVKLKAQQQTEAMRQQQMMLQAMIPNMKVPNATDTSPPITYPTAPQQGLPTVQSSPGSGIPKLTAQQQTAVNSIKAANPGWDDAKAVAFAHMKGYI